MTRCNYCSRPLGRGGQAAKQNPFCSACYEERVELHKAKVGPHEVFLEGNYAVWRPIPDEEAIKIAKELPGWVRRITEDETRERLLADRGVVTPCEECEGLGVHVYANTSTWRRGIGGAAMTRDICDVCWGSGDKENTWLNLRELDAQ